MICTERCQQHLIYLSFNIPSLLLHITQVHWTMLSLSFYVIIIIILSWLLFAIYYSITTPADITHL